MATTDILNLTFNISLMWKFSKSLALLYYALFYNSKSNVLLFICENFAFEVRLLCICGLDFAYIVHSIY